MAEAERAVGVGAPGVQRAGRSEREVMVVALRDSVERRTLISTLKKAEPGVSGTHLMTPLPCSSGRMVGTVDGCQGSLARRT